MTDRTLDYLPLDEIKRDPRNPKGHERDLIEASIGRLGFIDPAVLDERTGQLIGGHGRLDALVASRDRGDVVPDGIVVDGDGRWLMPVVRGWSSTDDAEAARALVVLNRATELGGWEPGPLRDLLADLPDLDLTGWASLDELPSLDPIDLPGGRGSGNGSLAERFLIPPFSVLDARQGWWQDRKRAWIALGIQSEVGRGGLLAYVGQESPDEIAGRGALTWAQGQRPVSEMDDTSQRIRLMKRGSPGGSHSAEASLTADGKTQRGDGRVRPLASPGGGLLPLVKGPDGYQPRPKRAGGPHPGGGGWLGRQSDGSTKPYDPKWASRTLGQGPNARRAEDGSLEYFPITDGSAGSGTSIFDPVLCELIYRWFTPPEGTVLDPFAGGSVRGIVAAWLGRSYAGVDLSGDQIEANAAQWADLGPRCPSGAAPSWTVGDSRTALPDVEADLVFSCPPYADLEEYSDDPADLSTLDYPEFRAAHAEVIAQAVKRLRQDRFAVWVIGEARGPDGNYYGLVPDTIRAFQEAGCALYNEAILVTAVGSLPVRAGKQFAAGRKLGKTHQNVLVFAKGDGRAAADACGVVDVSVGPEETSALV